MNQRLRQERTSFLLYLCTVFVALITALPIVAASLAGVRYVRAPAVQSVPSQPTFEQLDRNRDGYVDRSEAAALPGLEAVFNDADRRPDGRLDKVEYAKALGLMDGAK